MNRNATRTNQLAGHALRGLLVFYLLTLGHSVSALPVHIQIVRGGDIEYGAGFSVGKESECFVVAPLHVVEDTSADQVTVTDGKGRRANAQIVKSIDTFDVALLKIVGGVQFECPEDWDDGSNSAGDIDNAEFLIAKKINSNGRTEKNRLFVSAMSAEQLELEPWDEKNKIQEGDSGTSVYAGKRLVGMIVSVDTRSGDVIAISQSQIHGLFGGDVLPQARRTVLLYPFFQRNRENVYATMAAYDYVALRTPLTLMEPESVDARALARGQLPPTPPGIDYVVTGKIVSVLSKRVRNPYYKKSDGKKRSIGDMFISSLKKSVTKRNETSQYLRSYNIDVEVTVQDIVTNRRARNLERLSYDMPEDGAAEGEMRKTAVRKAVLDSMEITFSKYRLPLIER